MFVCFDDYFVYVVCVFYCYGDEWEVIGDCVCLLWVFDLSDCFFCICFVFWIEWVVCVWCW